MGAEGIPVHMAPTQASDHPNREVGTKRGKHVKARRIRTGRVAGALLAGLVFIAAACGGNDDGTDSGSGSSEESTPAQPGSSEAPATDAPAEEPVGDPVPGGTLRYGIEADVDGINPTSSALSAPGLFMANMVFDTLAAVDKEGNAVPFLAESFTPSADFKSWTVKLRPGIKFHDGTDLTSDALVKAFETERNDPLVGLAVRPYYPETGAITQVDDLTVTYNLLEPNMYFPHALTGQLGYVPSPTWVDAALADPTLNQQPVGTGPFKFDSRSQDSVTRFVRNEEYWGGQVWLDAVEFYPVTDPDARIELLLNGELEGLQSTDPAGFQLLRDDSSIVNNFDDAGEESFVMINSSKAPFDDVRVRKALTLATPRTRYNELFGLGENKLASQRFTEDSPYYNPDVVQEGDDPDAAVALIDEYCAENPVAEDGTALCTDGKVNMEFQWSGPAVVQTRIADLFNEAWSVAFNVTFDELAQDDHIQQTALGSYNVVTWRQFGADDPWADNVWLMCRNIGGISLNWPRYCSEERDQLLLDATNTDDPAERAALYQEVSVNMNEAYTYIFLQHTIWANPMKDTVHGVCDRTTPEGIELKCYSNGRSWFNTAWMG